MTRFALAAVALLVGATFVRAGDASVARYLVDERVHVAMICRPDRTGGEIAWLDTVTGHSGDARFSMRDGALRVETAPGIYARAHYLPTVALVFETTPWAPGGPSGGVALGLPVD